MKAAAILIATSVVFVAGLLTWDGVYRPFPERAADAVLAFVFLYFMMVSFLIFAMLLTGMSFDWAFRVVVASMNNTALGLPGQTAGTCMR